MSERRPETDRSDLVGKGDQLIGLGSAPVEDPTFRAAMFEQSGSNDLEAPVTTDIAGKSDAWASGDLAL